MLKQIRIIQSAPVILLLCNSHFLFAQSSVTGSVTESSVADYESSQETKKNRPQSQAIVTNKDIYSNNTNNQNLIQKLNDSNWNVTQDTQGSLILRTQDKTAQKPERSESTKKQWQELQNKFQAAGWNAKIDKDGSLRLTPRKIQTDAIENAENNQHFSFQDMQQKLKDSGWAVRNNSDGSIFLFPPQKSTSHKPYICTGTKPGVTVSLPVNSWQDAYDIASDWLQQAAIEHTSVGKIRKIFNIYLVSIVSDITPFTLKHQIVIRRTDGHVLFIN